MNPGILRLRLFVAKNTKLVYLALAGVGILLLVLGVLGVVNPPTRTVVERSDRRTVTVNTTTSAVVTGGGPWKEGERLVNSPVYLISATPTVNITSRVDVEPRGSIRASQNLILVLKATRKGETFWSSERVIGFTLRSNLDGGRSLRATLNIRDLRDRLRRIRKQVGNVGEVKPFLKLNVSYATSKYEGEVSKKVPITVSSNAFSLGGTLDVSRSHAETTERKVPKGGSTTFTLLSLGLVSFISARVVRDWDISFDVEAARRELHEARYSEWISEGSVPEEADASVRMESLEDLVDVAIDSNRRVIHDADEGVYAVIDDATSYYYVDGDDGNEEEN